MENEQYKGVGVDWAAMCFDALKPLFAAEGFLNAVEVKTWLGQNIKFGNISGYRNLEYRDYKAVFDIIFKDGQMYRTGFDFGQQAVHVTLGPGDVHSLYYRNPWVQ